MSKPKRIQRKRTKGWKMPPKTLCVTRPGKLGNPFKVGGWFAFGVKSMVYCQAAEGYQDSRFTRIETVEQSIAMFREYRKRVPLTSKEIDEIRAADFVACWCKEGAPCHADVLLEIVNSEVHHV